MNEILNQFNTSQPCPCDPSRELGECCLPVIRGDVVADTAELLMRSRYTAFALLIEDYLLQTWHSSTRPDSMELPSIQFQEWIRLEIHATSEGATHDQEGMVHYTATCRMEGKYLERLAEKSYFTREDGVWRYLDGQYEIIKKIGRNESCPCGSGKKYKRCCYS